MLVKRVRELNDSLCRCGGLMGPVRSRRGSGVTVLADRPGRVRSESEMNFREIGPGRFFPPDYSEREIFRACDWRPHDTGNPASHRPWP